MALKKEGVVCLNVIAFTNIICCSNKRCLQILPCQCQRSTRDWYIGNIKRCVCKVLMKHKIASRIKNVEKEKITAACKRSSVCNFFCKMKAASEVANHIVVPGFPLCPFSLQFSPPCLAPSQMLLMLECGRAEPWLLASCACPPHGWAMPSLCPGSPSSLRSLFSPLVNLMNLAVNIYLWDLSF